VTGVQRGPEPRAHRTRPPAGPAAGVTVADWSAERRARYRADPMYLPDPATEVIVGGRQSGKTYAAVAWVIDGRRPDGTNDRAIVARDGAYERLLVDDYGLRPDEVATVHRLKQSGRPRDRRRFVVDETADLLAHLLHIDTPALITVCTPDEEAPPRRYTREEVLVEHTSEQPAQVVVGGTQYLAPHGTKPRIETRDDLERVMRTWYVYAIDGHPVG
jgi:hypothetical protein